MEKLGLILAIALASAAISYTITSGSVMKWLRNLIAPIHAKLEQLIYCPWCTSHYVSMTILIFTSIALGVYHLAIYLTGWWWFDFLFTLFVIEGLVGIIHYFITFYNGKEGSFRRALIKANKRKPASFVYYTPVKEEDIEKIRLNFLAISGCSEDLVPIIRTIDKGYLHIYSENEIVTELWPTDTRADI